MYIHMFVCNLTPWNVETPVFRKADGFFDPTSTWTVQNYADTHMPLMQDCLAPLIDSTTRHYSTCSTYTHSTSLWLAFLASIQQGRALEHGFIVLNSVSMHAYWKYTRNLWNMDTSIFQTHSGGSYGVHIIWLSWNQWLNMQPVKPGAPLLVQLCLCTRPLVGYTFITVFNFNFNPSLPTHTHTHTHACTHAHPHTHPPTHTHTHARTHAHTPTPTHTHS